MSTCSLSGYFDQKWQQFRGLPPPYSYWAISQQYLWLNHDLQHPYYAISFVSVASVQFQQIRFYFYCNLPDTFSVAIWLMKTSDLSSAAYSCLLVTAAWLQDVENWYHLVALRSTILKLTKSGFFNVLSLVHLHFCIRVKLTILQFIPLLCDRIFYS